MSNKSKFLSTSATIIMVTSIVLGKNDNEALANPFSNLWQKFKTAGNSLTLTNPFKTSKSVKLNKPSSNGKISSTSPSKSLWTRFKNFFTSTSNSSKSSSVSTTTFKNPTFDGSKKSPTTTHTLKDTIKTSSKSKERRTRLYTTYNNDENLTPKTISSDDSNNISNNEKQPKTKPKLKTANPSVSFDRLSISSENSSSSLETKTSSNKNTTSDLDLILEFKSQLEVKKRLMDQELNHKYLLEKNINESNDKSNKQTLYTHLGLSNEKLTDLENEIKSLQQLIEDVQNQNSNSKNATGPIYVGPSLKYLKNLNPRDLEQHALKNNEVDLSNIKLTPPKGLTGDELYDFAVQNPVITHHVNNEGNIVTVNNSFYLLGMGERVIIKSHLRWANGKGFDESSIIKTYIPYQQN